MQTTEASVLIVLIMLFAVSGIKDIIDVILCKRNEIKKLEDGAGDLKKKGK